MRPRSRIQTTGPNNGHQLRDYSKSSNRSESPLIYTGILSSKLPLPPFDPRLYGAEGGGFDVKDLGDCIVVVV